jgi:N-methylhydantoinase B/oxoprolinase/acetone carboxylase alpha subunit
MKFRNGVVAALLLAASGTVNAQGWFHNDDRGGGGWGDHENRNDNGETSDNQRRACEPDAFRVCGRYIPDRDAIADCLHRNVNRLSPACRAVMEGRLK